MAQIGKAVGDTIQVGRQTHITEDFLLIYVFLPLMGLLTGLLQYLLLRRYLPRMGGWVVATLLGWLLLAVALYLVSTLVSRAVIVGTGWSTVLAMVLIGGALALPQWLVLRRRVPRAAGGSYPVSSAGGWPSWPSATPFRACWTCWPSGCCRRPWRVWPGGCSSTSCRNARAAGGIRRLRRR